ncbi:MAG TPA: hypothetical protein VGH43_03485 [Jatrophihabitans sp.]|jgi:hypothetical protein
MSEGISAGDSAVLVIRVWHEAHTPGGFRARILYEGAGDTAPRSTPASDPEDVLSAVQAWLAEHS